MKFGDHGNRIGGALTTAVVTLRPNQSGRHYRLPTDADYASELGADAILQSPNALSALHPRGSREKRLLDGMLLAVPR